MKIPECPFCKKPLQLNQNENKNYYLACVNNKCSVQPIPCIVYITIEKAIKAWDIKRITKPILMDRYLTSETKGNCTVEKLQEIKKELNYGENNTCPGWSCETCKKLFPKILRPVEGKDSTCPCDKYEADYLIKRVLEIKKHFPE